MKRQQDPVAGGMNVGLQVAVTESDGLLEGVQAVLAMQIGPIRRTATMRESRERHVEERGVSGPHGLIVPAADPRVRSQRSTPLRDLAGVAARHRPIRAASQEFPT